MENFKSFVNQYFWLIALLFLTVFGTLVFLINQDYETSKFDKTITNQKIAANKAVAEAANNNANSANFDESRRTEDVIRTQTIAPKIIEARRKSNNSKLELEKARKTYNEKKNSTDNLSNSDADNCLELKRLFPDIRFQDCQQN